MELFYAPDLSYDDLILDSEESRHCARVMRHRKGDEVRVTDGKGTMATSVVVENDPGKCILRVTGRKKLSPGPGSLLTMAVSPTKNQTRFEWFIEKSVEIGIGRIIPFMGEHSERLRLRHDRLKRLSLAAMKQSLRAHLPVIEEMTDFKSLISREISGSRYIAHIAPEPVPHLLDLYKKDSEVVILIGPEGDFSPDEVDDAKNSGFHLINLGPNRLRTETAALAACLMVNMANR